MTGQWKVCVLCCVCVTIRSQQTNQLQSKTCRLWAVYCSYPTEMQSEIQLSGKKHLCKGPSKPAGWTTECILSWWHGYHMTWLPHDMVDMVTTVLPPVPEWDLSPEFTQTGLRENLLTRRPLCFTFWRKIIFALITSAVLRTRRRKSNYWHQNSYSAS